MGKYQTIQSEFNKLSASEQSIITRSWNAFVNFAQSVLRTVAAQFTVDRLQRWWERLTNDY